MVKDVLFWAGGITVAAVVGCAIYALSRYLKKQKESSSPVERAFLDEISVSEVKKWFSEKMTSDSEVGVLLYPTEENIEKWNLEISKNDKIIIQLVFNQETNEVVDYREIAFSTMSDQLKKLLDDNGGSVVLEK